MNYLIGIGGTGGKCVEALTHMAAAGLGPDEGLYTFFVDPDKANGSLGRAQGALQDYTKCRKLNLGSIDLFRTEISIANPDVWSPLDAGGHDRLERCFDYGDMALRRPEAAALMDVL